MPKTKTNVVSSQISTTEPGWLSEWQVIAWFNTGNVYLVVGTPNLDMKLTAEQVQFLTSRDRWFYCNTTPNGKDLRILLVRDLF